MAHQRMKIYLGLGSNLGDRHDHLSRGIALLTGAGMRDLRVSPVVETPALLPDNAPPEWNKPYLNLVLEAAASGTALAWLPRIKAIQDEVGKRNGSRWSPRALDIDILLWGSERIEHELLSVPHEQLANRAFVLVPLAHLAPQVDRALLHGRTPLAVARDLEHRLPLWMGVLNITPDSFSDGGKHSAVASSGAVASPEAVAAAAFEMAAQGAHIIDMGAESTRPGATPIGADEEWQRLAPRLRAVLDAFAGDVLRPRISVDTYHWKVASQALELGVDIINDVGGLVSTDMRALAAGGGEWVAMHNLGLPADPARVLPPGTDPVAAVNEWLARCVEEWTAAGIDPARVIVDPGIGFGKTSLQSLDVLRRLRELHVHGLRLLVGHSRKSFMGGFSGPPETRDIETVGASLKLAEHGADVLRVHNVALHVRAFSAFSHLQAYT